MVSPKVHGNLKLGIFEGKVFLNVMNFITEHICILKGSSTLKVNIAENTLNIPK